MAEMQHEFAQEVVEEVKEPSMYKVLLLNDDFTEMDFVVMVLMMVFHKPLNEARHLMLQVHSSGRAICGVYTYEMAETKVAQVGAMAESHRCPLQCVMEEA
jgi:ATP-dependent Clp protease adaptor protein ClpS